MVTYQRYLKAICRNALLIDRHLVSWEPPICVKVIGEFKWPRFVDSLAGVVLFTDVHTVKSLMAEMENDSSRDEMTEDEPTEQGIATRVIGKNRLQMIEHCCTSQERSNFKL